MSGLEAVSCMTIIAAATPLLLAAIGELVVERAGVLNLGVEGMMIMGAVAGIRGRLRVRLRAARRRRRRWARAWAMSLHLRRC